MLYSVPTGTKRDYGTVTLQDGSQLPDLPVAEGYLKLRDDAGKREESGEASELIERLKVLESKARAEEKGQWNTNSERVKTSYEIKNVDEFVRRWSGTKVDGTCNIAVINWAQC